MNFGTFIWFVGVVLFGLVIGDALRCAVAFIAGYWLTRIFCEIRVWLRK